MSFRFEELSSERREGGVPMVLRVQSYLESYERVRLGLLLKKIFQSLDTSEVNFPIRCNYVDMEFSLD